MFDVAVPRVRLQLAILCGAACMVQGTNAAGDATVPGGDLDVNTYNQQGESAQLQALEGVQAMAGQGVEQGRIQPTSMVTLGKSIPNTDRAAGADEAGPSTPDPNARCTPVPRQGKRALNAAVAADASADKRIATGKATKRAGDGGIASGAGDDEQVLVCVPTLPVSSSPLQHVGKRYWLWWRGDKKWYAGQITKYDPTKGQRGQVNAWVQSCMTACVSCPPMLQQWCDSYNELRLNLTWQPACCCIAGCALLACLRMMSCSHVVGCRACTT